MPKLIKDKIGILSGMGAAAGAFFYTYLVKECQWRGAVNDSDFPEIVIYSLSCDALDNTGVIDKEVLEKNLLSGIKFLNWSGCEKIIIACNSAYICYDFLQKNTAAAILHMPKIAMKKCKGKYGVISSRFSRETKIYGGLQIDEYDQEVIDGIIGRLIAGEKEHADLIALQMIIGNLKNMGAKEVIIGCTELSLLGSRDYEGVKVIDASKEVIKELFHD